MSDETLDTGMKPAEAVKRARKWWNERGRFLTKQEANEVEQGRKVLVSNGKGPGIVIPGEQTPVLNSGILRGAKFERLDRSEQLAVVKHWHHHYVRKPNLEAEKHALEHQDRDARLKLN